MQIWALRVASAEKFAASVLWRRVSGATLLLDFTFYLHPNAIGHWWEMIGPLYR